MILKKINLILVFLLGLFLVGCTQKASDPKVDNWNKYKQQDSITIGFDNTFVPMGFEEKNGQYVGFDIDWPSDLLQYFLKVQVGLQSPNNLMNLLGHPKPCLSYLKLTGYSETF